MNILHIAVYCFFLSVMTACSNGHKYIYNQSSESLARGTKSVDMTESTDEAAEARQYATAEILDAFAPDDCSFNQVKNIYQCDNAGNASEINEHIDIVRQKINLLLQLNGYPTNSEEKGIFGNTILRQLYNCQATATPHNNREDIYCDTEIPTKIIIKAKESGLNWEKDTSYIGVHKYFILK